MFPTLDRYTEVSKEQMWKNFVNLIPLVKSDKFFIDSYQRGKTGFNPMPPKFSGEYRLVDSSKVDYFTVDGITDFYTEEQRMRARKFYRPNSPWAAWTSSGIDLNGLSKEEIKAHRDKIYATHSEATLFRPSWAKGVLTVLVDELRKHPRYQDIDLEDVTILDGSSGWGDRLLAAMALGLQYRGFDPNTALKPGHDSMIADHGSTARHSIRYEPYETATDIPRCHVAFTSPPFYKLEVYNGQNQSTDSYPEFKLWMEKFLLRSLKNTWDALLPGGIMAIHLCDYFDKNGTYNMIQPVLNQVIQFEQSAWLGVIGLVGERGKVWPVWCWRKD